MLAVRLTGRIASGDASLQSVLPKTMRFSMFI